MSFRFRPSLVMLETRATPSTIGTDPINPNEPPPEEPPSVPPGDPAQYEPLEPIAPPGN